MAEEQNPNVSNIRTLEDLTNMVSILFFNLNSLSRTYYDMFINPIPMTLELERYDETGRLETITLNNRAKDMQSAYTGVGDPNGQQIARIGALYVDTEASALYYKGSGSDAFGWILIWNALNLVEGIQYLSPSGNGSQLTSLNADSIASGTLPVIRGGSGVPEITGIIKGTGTNPFAAAVDGTDFLGPLSCTGIICYYPVLNTSGTLKLPKGWLRCDGTAYSTSTYNNLYKVIGTTYGSETGKFRVPNLTNMFIRCWDGSRAATDYQTDDVCSHKHHLSVGSDSKGGHTHTGNSLSHTHSIPITVTSTGADADGTWPLRWNDGDYAWRGVTAPTTGAASGWSGSTDNQGAHTHTVAGDTYTDGSVNGETRVKNLPMVPIIKY